MESMQYAEIDQIKTQIKQAWFTPIIEQSDVEEHTQLGATNSSPDAFTNLSG